MFSRFAKYALLLGLEILVIGCLVYLLAEKMRGAPALAPTATITASLTPPERMHELVFVGDMMFDRSIRRVIERTGDPLAPFALIAERLRAADLAIGNLEGPISDRGTRQGSIYSFRFPPAETIAALKSAGFDVVSLANNHIWDYGRVGARDTMQQLRDAGIKYMGFGETHDEANAPVIQRIGSTMVALLGYTEFYGKTLWADDRLGVSEFDPDVIVERIAEIKRSKTADIVVVSLHWGVEYKTQSNAAQQKIARKLIDAGADLIIGHHPHVPQEIEYYNGRAIVYSLGNFVFDQNFSEETRRGLLVSVLVQSGKIISVVPEKLRFTADYQPYIAE